MSKNVTYFNLYYIDNIQHFDSKYFSILLESSLEEGTSQQEDIIPWKNIVVIGSLGIIYIYQFAFELMKQKEDIGSYQLLGFRKKEIYQIYFYKAIMMSIVGISLGSLYFYLDMYYTYRMLNIEKYIFHISTIIPTFTLSLIVIIGIVGVSMLPLYPIMKKDGLENRNIRE